MQSGSPYTAVPGEQVLLLRAVVAELQAEQAPRHARCNQQSLGSHCSCMQVLLLRAVVAQLQAELAPRLAAFRDTAGTATAAKAAAGETGPAAQRRREGLTRHRRRLLEESHLWRLLAVRWASRD